MKVLLTGATGFIGSHVARRLVDLGHEVHATIRPGSDRRRLRGIESRIRIWDGEMDVVPLEPDLAIHIAWYLSPVDYLTASQNRDCLEASRRLLRRLKCRALFAGTAFELDTQLGVMHEDSPVKPLTLYSQCKDELRREVVARPDSAWTRFFYQYGPREDARRQVPTIIRSLLKGDAVELSAGEQQRDYLHVDDVASAVCATALSKLTGTVNVGAGTAPKLREIWERIGALTGRPELLRLGAKSYYPGEPMLIVADNEKLRSTGWSPQIGLDAGLRSAVDWWRSAQV